MSFSTAGGSASRPEINVTPLIDVLLVLIIMFMVIVAMSKEYKVDADLPQPAENQPHQIERTIVIQIIWSAEKQAPLLKINQESVAWDDLEPELARIFLRRAEKVVYVKGDVGLDFEPVAQVIAEAHNAGIDRVGLVTED
jgi:biopolymer transport protein ExbD/biopolymer transport protein TolR